MHKLQHLTEKETGILSYFYGRKQGHVREIKRNVQMSEHTLLKYLSALEEKGMLVFRKEGNMKLYEANLKSSVVKIMFAYFDLLRIESLEYKRGKAVKMLIGALKVRLPFFALLFGSTAKGGYTAKSDIDIIIVYDSVTKETEAGIKDINRKILAETGIKINAVIMGVKEFVKEKENKANFALQDAIAHGYPVFGNQLYYEVIFG